MSIILPSTSLPSPTKLTPHEALVKFGEDLTQRASQVPVSNDSTDGIEPASSLKEMLLKSQTGLNDNTVGVSTTNNVFCTCFSGFRLSCNAVQII